MDSTLQVNLFMSLTWSIFFIVGETSASRSLINFSFLSMNSSRSLTCSSDQCVRSMIPVTIKRWTWSYHICQAKLVWLAYWSLTWIACSPVSEPDASCLYSIDRGILRTCRSCHISNAFCIGDTERPSCKAIPSVLLCACSTFCGLFSNSHCTDSPYIPYRYSRTRTQTHLRLYKLDSSIDLK